MFEVVPIADSEALIGRPGGAVPSGVKLDSLVAR